IPAEHNIPKDALIHKVYQTYTCFPMFQHSGINYPPFAEANSPPFSPERSFVLAIFPLVIFCILIFIEENIPLTPCKTQT
ncbi:hypothetical protein, partial [Allisonella histaminiformans]|uniref:hypothetical protein n=1 Tax=Allisonella histaminiformans TaxID=209880 RepID=UPI00240A57CD